MALNKKSVQHLDPQELLTSENLSRPDKDLEENLDNIVTHVNNEKASLYGDPNVAFKVADPEEMDDVVNKRTALNRYETDISLSEHIEDTNNPHNSTKSDIGLGNVKNEEQASVGDVENHIDVVSGAHGTGTAATYETDIGCKEVVKNENLIVENKDFLSARLGQYTFTTGELLFPHTSHFFSKPITFDYTVSDITSSGDFFYATSETHSGVQILDKNLQEITKVNWAEITGGTPHSFFSPISKDATYDGNVLGAGIYNDKNLYILFQDGTVTEYQSQLDMRRIQTVAFASTVRYLVFTDTSIVLYEIANDELTEVDSVTQSYTSYHVSYSALKGDYVLWLNDGDNVIQTYNITETGITAQNNFGILLDSGEGIVTMQQEECYLFLITTAYVRRYLIVWESIEFSLDLERQTEITAGSNVSDSFVAPDFSTRVFVQNGSGQEFIFHVSDQYNNLTALHPGTVHTSPLLVSEFYKGEVY